MYVLRLIDWVDRVANKPKKKSHKNIEFLCKQEKKL